MNERVDRAQERESPRHSPALTHAQYSRHLTHTNTHSLANAQAFDNNNNNTQPQVRSAGLVSLDTIPTRRAMSIESAQQASSNQSATPRHAGASKAATSAPQQQQQQQVAMSAMVQMNDVLLGDEMSMMGCDVESWNTARPHFHMQPHTPQAAPPQPTAFFACPPANLTRHMSLPVSMMRHDAVPHPVLHYAAPPSTPVHAVAMPPTLVRHHSHGYVMTPQPQHVQFHVSRPVHPMQMQQMFELSIAHQHHQLSPHAMTVKHESAFAPTMNVEPMPFTPSSSESKQASAQTQQTSRLSIDDSFDLEPLPYAVFASSERPKNIQQLESAIESLDRLLPDIEHDLFQQQQAQAHAAFAAMEQQQHAMAMNANLITPRPVVYGRSALPLLLSPQGKDLATSPATMSAIALSGMLVSNQSYNSSYTPKSARNMATCSVDGCDRRVRSKGFCKTHGGGRKCNIEGCKKSSQNGEFCIGHGGGKKCKEDGCAKAAQSHGLCKAHGGGARCKFLDCNKSSQGGGLCRAHGGGKRCQASGCPKGAQRGNFCATHGGFRNCKIDGCVRTDRGGGFCEVHRRGRLCKIDGCKKLSRNQGMCTMHIREEKQDETAESEEDATMTSAVLLEA